MQRAAQSSSRAEDDPRPSRVPRRIQGAVKVLLWASLVVELALAFWFRTSSLGAVPAFGADEAFYGIQARRLAQGLPFLTHTVTGNIADPFLILAQLPFHYVLGPTTWVPVLPVAVSGILAAVLAYPLLRRVLDPSTALAASALHATLPAAIIFARFGCEFGQTPLVGLIAAYFALRGKVVWLLVSVAAALLVHPTNIFLAPILGPVALVRIARVDGDDPGRSRRLRRGLAALTIGTVGASALILSRPMVRSLVIERFHHLRDLDWFHYLDGFTIMLAQGPPLPGGFGTGTAILASTVLGLLAIGLASMVLRRHWDRAALVVGLALGLASLHLFSGSNVFLEATRYGSVLITPLILVAACLIRELVPGPGPRERLSGGPIRLALLVSLCGLSLLATYRNVFQSPTEQRTAESIWTFGAEEPGPPRRILALIREDMARDEPRDAGPNPPRLILAQDYFVATPLEYFLDNRRDDVAVVQLVSIPELGMFVLGQDPMAPRIPQIAARLAAGDYAIRGDSAALPASQFIERTIAEHFDEDQVQCWPIPRSPGVRVYRINSLPDDEAVARQGLDEDRRRR